MSNVRRSPLPEAPVADIVLGPVDWKLLALFLMLLCVGLLAVLSASGPISQRTFGESYHFFHRQLQFMALGGAVVIILCWMPRPIINKLHYWGIAISIVLLIWCVLSPHRINGSSRWIRIASLSIQPMEFTRVALVLYLAYFLSSKQKHLRDFSRGLVPPTLITGIICLLLLMQPDLGGAVLMCSLLFFMCLAGGTKGWYLGGLLILGAAAIVVLIVAEPYRFARWTAYLEPFADAQGNGYQIVQSLLALGNGGIFGVGLGGSLQKIRKLPEAHNDFVMSIIGEEAGFLGLTLVMILFALFFYRCYLVVLRQKDLRDRFTAYGLTLVMALSFLLNIAVILGSVPPKGIAMPFISYGGSSLLSNMICAGLLLNYSRTARE